MEKSPIQKIQFFAITLNHLKVEIEKDLLGKNPFDDEINNLEAKLEILEEVSEILYDLFDENILQD